MITKEQYEFAQGRVEALLPLVDDSMPLTDPRVVELSLMADIVIAYEKEYFPIGIEASGIAETRISHGQLSKKAGAALQSANY